MKEYNTIEEYFTREIEPIFEKVAQEAQPTRVLGGSPKVLKITYKPHNIRRWINFSKITFTPKPKKSYINPSSTGNKGLGYFISHGTQNYNTENFYQFEHFNFTVKKNTILVQCKKLSRKVFDVPLSEQGKNMIINLQKGIDNSAVQALKSFMTYHGGASNFSIINRSSEDKYQDDPLFERMDTKSTWNNEVAKKVYKKELIEFKNPIFLQNFIVSRSIMEQTPTIGAAIGDLALSIRTIDPLRYLKSVCKSVKDLIEYEELVRTLSREELRDLSEWSFLGCS